MSKDKDKDFIKKAEELEKKAGGCLAGSKKPPKKSPKK